MLFRYRVDELASYGINTVLHRHRLVLCRLKDCKNLDNRHDFLAEISVSFTNFEVDVVRKIKNLLNRFANKT